jgi:hypothetical protein
MALLGGEPLGQSVHCSFNMRYGVTLLLGLTLASGLAACGDKKTDGTKTALPKEDVAAAEIERFQTAENARSRITMVDAASGDAAAMPGEWTGPTAYDLRPKEGATKARPAPDASPVAAKPPTPELFPSVAE